MKSIDKEFDDVFHKDIETLSHKFDQVRSKKHILKWINNFDEDNKIYALDLLGSLTYISQEDVRSQCASIMREILELSKSHLHIYMIPIGNYGKSSSLIAYYLRKTNAFKELEDIKKISFLENESLLETLIFYKGDKIIFYDDFFGTGYSLIKDLRKYGKHSNKSFVKTLDSAEAYGLFYMKQCLENLKASNYSISMHAHLHHPIFGKSPRFFENDFITVKYKAISQNVAEKKGLFTTLRNKYSLGYKNSEAFISFAHTTPNNTLPIIWSNKAKWFPIFGATDDILFNILKEKKMVMAKLALDNKFSITFDQSFEGKFQLTNYLLFGIIYCIDKKWAEPRIMTLLGMDLQTFDLILEIGKNKKLISENNGLTLTAKGLEFLKEINFQILESKNYKKIPTTLKKDYIAKEFSG
ncbi:hypothetical protein [Sphingobacterium sp. 2149]|uniref:phosphoribosyltransferase-like protein n=1 Tax=Sphingobacterium sp. 2149 TaxID=2817763 RepID=UPI002862D809|nr:hypothetical protein [Sphingobacterium sp. 2149]MDR6734910.1 putative transcriptional regulator [Sphingobacterium sp. 2149]